VDSATQTFGLNAPILLNQAGAVIAGHGRILSRRELGWPTVPLLRLYRFSNAQAYRTQPAVRSPIGRNRHAAS
jgi:hypothetical protein